MTVSPVSDTPDPPDAPVLAELPEQVRARVVALAAEVLPAVPRLPAPVRRVADFAPARRAPGGSAIVDALDDEGVPPPGRHPGRGPAGVGLRPATDAAHAWLVRPDGWAGRPSPTPYDGSPDRPVRGDDRAARGDGAAAGASCRGRAGAARLRAEQRGRL